MVRRRSGWSRTSATWATRYVKSGPKGRRLTGAQKIDELIELATGFFMPKLGYHVTPERFSDDLGPACSPSAPAPLTTPLNFIRHVRPLRLQSEAYAGAAT